jgi:hypothetical protein
MARLDDLRMQFARVDDALVSTEGYALWILWHGEVNPVVLQTLEDYGGVKMAEESRQSLWFFFSADALLAAARIGVWARFNPLALGLQIFPAHFMAGHDGGKSLSFDEDILRLDLVPPTEFQVWTHSAMKPTIDAALGLNPAPGKALPDGLDKDIWSALEIDPRLPYQASLTWYVVLRPSGNPLDKAFQAGWREFFGQLESVLQRNKFRFTINDFFVMFPLENLRQAKSWTRDFLNLIARLKRDAPESYWPCVMALVDRKGLNLNSELPKKCNVDWEQLIPDYPHMSLRTALMLGEGFAVHEARFAPTRRHPDDWAGVSLLEESGERGGSLPQLVPINLVTGRFPHCFYCGQRGHAGADCPSRLFERYDPGDWSHVGKLEFSAMRAIVRAIDGELGDCADEDARRAYILSGLGENSEKGVMLRAFYSIVWPVQHRCIGFFWRARDKDLQKAAKELAPVDNNPVWSLLADFRQKDNRELDKELQTLGLRYSKDFRILSLRGFLALEHGDAAKAEALWKEAEMYGSHPVNQAWHIFLQARALEFQGKFAQAGTLYEQVARTCPSWRDAEYRRLVCLVKNGFPELAVMSLIPLIEKDGHFFNKAMIDPELERGHIQVLAMLHGSWTSMETRAKDEEANLGRMGSELAAWFMPGHPFAEEVTERIHRLLQGSSVKNFVAFQTLVMGRVQLERDIQNFVAQEARAFKSRFRQFAERLKVIQEESAWFPFPRALAEFNKSYNQGVANMNWAMTANFHTRDVFRKAQTLADQESERVRQLEGRLKFLRMVRDATLFTLSVTQSFFWMELVGILLIFVILPLLLLYGDKLGLEGAVNALARDRWQLQKALFLVITVLAAGIAGVRTILRFERIRGKILAKAKEAAIARAKAVAAAAQQRGRRRP